MTGKQSTHERRNLLFIYTDEQRFDTLAAYGNELIQMPNLNALAGRATVVEEAYVTQPVCTPSRSSLLTGLYPHTNGCIANNVPLPEDVRCLPEMLSSDYVCGHLGKWHLGDEIFPQHGFAHWRGIEDGYREQYAAGRDRSELSHYQRWLQEKHGLTPPPGKDYFSRPDVTELPEECSKPAFLAEEAESFLRDHKDDPFALYVNFLEPHMPFSSARDDQYDPASIPLPENFEATPDETFHPRTRANTRKAHKQYPDEKAFRELRARYYGLCSLVDTYVGRILSTLAELGLNENTIVVFTSDHGDMMGSHGQFAKTVMYQEAVRVPLLIRVPGQTEQRRIQGPVSQIDVVPTLLDLMGVSVPPELEGKSRAELCVSGGRVEEDVFIEWNGPNGAGQELDEELATDPVRTVVTPDGWRCSLSPLGYHELINLREDPLETTNLAPDPAYRSVLRDLAGHVKSWQERTSDSSPITL